MAGKKTFVAGEVLLAQDVNDLLMDQTIMNFASSAARSSAIPTPTEGMFTVTTDNDQLDYYNGSAFVSALPIGAWTTYTPTLFGLSLGNGTATFAYAQIGKTVHVRGRIANGTTTSSTGANKGFTLPFTVSTGYGAGIYPNLGVGMYFSGGTLFPCSPLLTTNQNVFWVAHTSSGTYVNTIDIGPSVPATFGLGAELHVQVTFERS
jgi:hypothetical protein